MTVTIERSMRWAMTIAVLVSAATLTAGGPQQSPAIAAQEDHRGGKNLLGIAIIPSGPDLLEPGAYNATSATPDPVTEAASNLGTIVLNAKVRGNEVPIGGTWEWTGTNIGANRKTYKVTLKVKFKGAGLTGNWFDTDNSRKVDRARYFKGIADGVIVNTNTFTFKRCYTTAMISMTINPTYYESDYELRDRFVECKPHQFNMTVVHYAGTITGNQLILTTTTKRN